MASCRQEMHVVVVQCYLFPPPPSSALSPSPSLPPSLSLSLPPSLPPSFSPSLALSPSLPPKDDEEEEITPGYKAPKKVDLQTIQNLDADDESLVKYKQQLLGQTTDVKGNRSFEVRLVGNVFKWRHFRHS